jgi:hypothetical protein
LPFFFSSKKCLFLGVEQLNYKLCYDLLGIVKSNGWFCIGIVGIGDGGGDDVTICVWLLRLLLAPFMVHATVAAVACGVEDRCSLPTESALLLVILN